MKNMSLTAEKSMNSSKKVYNNFYNVFNPEILYNFNFNNGQKDDNSLRFEKSAENLRIFPRNVLEKYSIIDII